MTAAIEEESEFQLNPRNCPKWLAYEIEKAVDRRESFKVSDLTEDQRQHLGVVLELAEQVEKGFMQVRFNGKASPKFSLTELGNRYVERELLPKLRNQK